MSDRSLYLFIVVIVSGLIFHASATFAQPTHGLVPVATKILEIGTVNDRLFSSKFSGLLDSIAESRELDKWYSYSPEIELIIVNYGNSASNTRRERLITRALEKSHLYHLRVTIVRGGTCKSEQTIFWQVPRGAKLPEVCEGKPN